MIKKLNTKPLAFLLSLTFLFLFSGFVYGEEPEVKREFWEGGRLKSEIHYKNGKPVGLYAKWDEDGNQR